MAMKIASKVAKMNSIVMMKNERVCCARIRCSNARIANALNLPITVTAHQTALMARTNTKDVHHHRSFMQHARKINFSVSTDNA